MLYTPWRASHVLQYTKLSCHGNSNPVEEVYVADEPSEHDWGYGISKLDIGILGVLTLKCKTIKVPTPECQNSLLNTDIQCSALSQ